ARWGPGAERAHRPRAAGGRRWPSAGHPALECGGRAARRGHRQGLDARPGRRGRRHRQRARRQHARTLGQDHAGLIAGQPLLTRLVAESLSEMVRRRTYTDQAELVRSAAAYTPLDFAAALRGPGLAVIAEMKQRTPSMGVLAKSYRPERLARGYSEAGATAPSVLKQEATLGVLCGQ